MSRQVDQDITYMPTRNRARNLGTSLNDDTARLDAVAKVTGSAKFGRDVYPDGCLFVAFVRCPFGAAKLESVDVEAARNLPGVLEVVSQADEGTYHGQNVGYIVAESPHAARRGLRALNMQWKRQPVQTRILDAADDPPEIDPATAALLEGADHVLEATYSTPVQTHSALETHGASIDHTGDRATVYISTQGTFAARDGLDEALGLPRSNFDVVCEYVGGGFGAKLSGAGKEGMTAARVAAHYQRPVYLFVDRAEEHLDTGNRPSSRTQVTVGFRGDGTVVGGQIHTWGGVGVSRRGGGIRFPSGRYDLGKIEKTHQDVRLNAGAPRPFRAPGSPQGAFVEELMLDEMATIAGIDPLALRLKLETSDDRRAMFQQGAELIGWGERQATGSQAGTIRRGLGLGSTSWGRFPTQAEAEVEIHRDGSVEARSGTQDIGTGQRTVMGVVAAKSLGVPLSAVAVNIGRSSLPVGPGSGGSVTTHNTAPAMQAAALDARQKLLAAMAEHLGADPGDLDVVGGRVMQGDEPVMEWTDACRALDRDSIVGRGSWDRGSRSKDSSTGHSEGVQFVDLTVDVETGVIAVKRIVAIQACGQVVCRKTAESQIIGGVTQGISFALFEDKILDRNVGTMVNPDMEWYKIIGTADMPHIEPVLWTKGQTGPRSLGEPPTIPTAGAIAGAVYNAIGVPLRHLPLTPDKILAALEGGAA